jgi:hypothetical protein
VKTKTSSFLSLNVDDLESLEATARSWAESALRSFRGEALRRALDISAAIVDFVAEIEE